MKFSWKVRPSGMVTSARVGWALACPHPWELGMGRALRHNGADGSKNKRTRKATRHPVGHPNLTFRRPEKKCPLERCKLVWGEALCRAALKP